MCIRDSCGAADHGRYRVRSRPRRPDRYPVQERRYVRSADHHPVLADQDVYKRQPFYVAICASLLQIYQKSENSIRLVLLDEAFSKMTT